MPQFDTVRFSTQNQHYTTWSLKKFYHNIVMMKKYSTYTPKIFLYNFYKKLKHISNHPQLYSKDVSQNDKEKWAIAMCLLGIYKMRGIPWWVASSEEDPPDGVAITFKEINKTLKEIKIPMEVVFVPRKIGNQKWTLTHTLSQSIFNFLNQKKLSTKFYTRNTHLICYFNFSLLDNATERLAKLIKNSEPRLQEIWYIAKDKKNSSQYVVGQIYPVKEKCSISIGEFIN